MRSLITDSPDVITFKIGVILYRLLYLSAVVTALMLGFKMAGIIHVKWMAVFSALAPSALLVVVHKAVEAYFFELDEEHYYGE